MTTPARRSILPWLAAAALWAAPCGAKPAPSACLSPAEVESRLKAASVRLRSSTDQGTGFFVKDADGAAWLVTAWHLAAPKAKPDDCAPRKPPADGSHLAFVPLRSTSGRTDGLEFSFRVSPGDVDYGNDAVKTVAPKTAQEVFLAPAATGQMPQVGDELLIAGFPGGKYASFPCLVMGYSKSLYGDVAPNVALRCAEVKERLAGISGGAVVSSCTGLVVGVVSYQESSRCRKGRVDELGAGLLHAGEGGRLTLGLPPAPFSTLCWDWDKNGTALVSKHRCQVGHPFQ